MEWVANESYIKEDTGTFLLLSGRGYDKVNQGKALVACYYLSEGFTCPLLVSTEPDPVIYQTIGFTITYATTVEYLDTTWYVSGNGASMGGDIVPSGFAKKLPGVYSTIETAAIALLETAGVEILPEQTVKYLIRNEDMLYTIQDGALQALSEATVTADLFREYGVDSVDTALITDLDYPSILKWTEGEEISLNATLEAMPPLPQICYTRNYIFDDSVVGISSCQIVSDSQTKFAFSFDNGLTWKKIMDGEWEEVESESDGMTAQEVNALTESEWGIVTMQWKVRFALYENSAVSTIKMNYKNVDEEE